MGKANSAKGFVKTLVSKLPKKSLSKFMMKTILKTKVDTSANYYKEGLFLRMVRLARFPGEIVPISSSSFSE